MYVFGTVIGIVFWICVAVLLISWLVRDPPSYERAFESNFRRQARTKTQGCLGWAALIFFAMIVWGIWRFWDEAVGVS
jgi:hypothetical protein